MGAEPYFCMGGVFKPFRRAQNHGSPLSEGRRTMVPRSPKGAEPFVPRPSNFFWYSILSIIKNPGKFPALRMAQNHWFRALRKDLKQFKGKNRGAEACKTLVSSCTHLWYIRAALTSQDLSSDTKFRPSQSREMFPLISLCASLGACSFPFDLQWQECTVGTVHCTDFLSKYCILVHNTYYCTIPFCIQHLEIPTHSGPN